MKKTIKRVCALAAAACLAAAFCLPVFAQDTPPAVSCGAYVVMDADTGQILIEQNPDQKMYPASTTKIMTLGLTAQKTGGNWDESVTVSEEAVYSLLHTDSSHIALQPGEIVPLKDVVYGTQLASANDGANVLAAYIGGSIQGGVNAMNAQAQALGLTGTHFANTHGLPDENHYTTAHDMALILSEAEKNADFVRISGSATWDLPETSMNPARTLKNTDLLVNPESDLYMDAVTCGKTGYTGDAGRCLAAGASKDGLDVVGVVMAAPESEGSTAAISNMHDLLSWGLSAWQTTSIVNAGDVLGTSAVRLSKDGEKLNVSAADAITATLPAGTAEDDLDVSFSWQGPLTAPVEAGEPLGTATVSYQGRELGAIGVVAAFGMRLSIPAFVMDWLSDPIHMVIVVVALVALFVLVGLLASRGSRRRQRDLRREHDRRRAQAAGRRVGAHYATPRKKR